VLISSMMRVLQVLSMAQSLEGMCPYILHNANVQLLLSLVKAAHHNIRESGTNALENHFLPGVNSPWLSQKSIINTINTYIHIHKKK